MTTVEMARKSRFIIIFIKTEHEYGLHRSIFISSELMSELNRKVVTSYIFFSKHV